MQGGVNLNKVDTAQIIRQYYRLFNEQDLDGFLALLTNDVVHEISQGVTQVGKETFRQFMLHMNHCYAERVYDLEVMTNPNGNRAAAEFMLEGRYLQTDGALPTAKGQNYTLRVGAFFVLRDGLIARVSNHYNLQDWLAQVSAK